METMALRPRRRFTVEDYYRMAEAGILGEDDRVELIDGQIVEMPPIGSPHASAVDTLTQLFVRAAGERAIVRVQGPIRLDEWSEPEPDVSLLRPRPDRYRTSHPGPNDVLLVIEVAHATVAFDRRVKLPLYARAGIREYWLVDLTRGVIEVYRSPGRGRYLESLEARPGERVAPAALPDVEVDTAELLGSGSSRP